MERQTTRPTGVSIISILLGIHGIVAILVGFGLLGAYPAMVGFLGVALQLVYGVVLLMLAGAMWSLQGWAWLVTLTVVTLNLVFTIIALFAVPGFWALWLLLLIQVIVIAYLLQEGVRSRFTAY